jgi:hypothetical protein
MKLNEFEKRNYVFKEKDDFVILSKIKRLEEKRLQPTEKEMVKLARSQLKRNWRTPLIRFLDKMMEKQKKVEFLK